MTEAEVKEKLIRLLVENEKKFDLMASYKRYAVIYNYKTIPELIKILQKAGVDPAEINKIMEE
jgi:flagellar basal body P-ring protein FlgI